ncbi:MAG: hypothetical protein ACLPJH_12590 [Myxococcaceae bacterium]
MSSRFPLVLSALLLAAASFAQAPPRPVPAPPEEKASEVPDAQKLSRSSAAVAQMQASYKAVLGKLEEARNTKDVVKLNCVNEKLTQVKGLLRISEQSDVALQEAVAKKDGPTADHEYTKVSIAQSKVEQLRTEADQCIGQLAFRTDENLSVEVLVPSDLPGGDPTNPPPPTPATVCPPPASPTM